jgi:hypothetical protein
MNNERIRHLSGVITNAALAELGVIGYTRSLGNKSIKAQKRKGHLSKI